MGRYTNGSGLFSASEFKNRGVVKLAPDALVYINNGSGTTVISPITGLKQKVDFDDGISSISIQNNVDPPGSSSATIEITTPRYNEKSNFWVDYKDDNSNTFKIPVLIPMMEVQIYLKGRFLVGESPQYYPAFWGFILNVEESFNGGLWKITLQCADMLHWWSWLEVAYRPSVAAAQFQNGTLTVSTVFGQMNPFEIIYSLCQSNNHDSFIPPNFLAKLNSKVVDGRSSDWNSFYSNVIDYWNKRFKNQANYLKMYGVRGNSVLVTSNSPQDISDVKSADESTQSIRKPPVLFFHKGDELLRESKVFYQYETIGKDLSEAEYLTRLQVATELKTRVDYEFYQDVNGNFIFKPPFYNINVKSVLPYVINPQEIINYSAVVNNEEIITCIQATAGLIQPLQGESKSAYHVDMDLMKQYGFRQKIVTPWYLGNQSSDMLQSYCVSHMSICNAKANTATVTIPGRPEIRLGYPVYLEHNDTFYYVKSINHTFDFGGSFSTNLSLEAGRKKIYSTKGEVQKSYVYKVRPTGINIGGPSTGLTAASSSLPESKSTELDDNMKVQNIKRSVGLIKSMEPGFYDLVPDPSVTLFTDSEIPYTDEDGYKVVGGFPYGRGVVLNAGNGASLDNTLNLTPNQIRDQRQTQDVLNIRPIADSEGAFMDDYFKQTKKKEVENYIPEYLKFPQKTDKDGVSYTVVNIIPSQASGDDDPENALISKPMQSPDPNPVVFEAGGNSDTPSTPNTAGLTADTRTDLQRMIDDAAELGVTLTVTSGQRSYDEQKKLFDRWNRGDRVGIAYQPADPDAPGWTTSIKNHCAGYAVDFSEADGSAAFLRKNPQFLADYNFSHPFSDDPVHFVHSATQVVTNNQPVAPFLNFGKP